MLRKKSKIRTNFIIEPNYKSFKGLGKEYWIKLHDKPDAIHQLDSSEGVIETRGSVKSRATSLAHGMLSKGLKPLDVILLCSRSHCDQTITVLAAFFLSLIVAVLDIDVPYEDYLLFVGRVKPKLAFCDWRAVGTIDSILESEKIKCEVVAFGKSLHGAKYGFQDLLTSGNGRAFLPSEVGDPRSTIALITHTQGTRSEIKLVCLSHLSIYVQALNFFKHVEASERLVSYFPLSYILEVVLMCSCFEYPITRILPGDVSPRAFCKLVHDMRIDLAFLPTALANKVVLDVALKDYSLRTLKAIYIGGMPVYLQQIKLLRQFLEGIKVAQIYSSSEAGCVAACSFRDYNLSLDHITTVGKLFPGVKLKVVDPDTRSNVPPDCLGEIVLCSPYNMLGYYKDPRNARVMDRMYLRTGDLGQLDKEGWIYVKGQTGDVFRHQSEQIEPWSLIDHLLTHPFVSDAAVVGDERDLVVCVVLLPGTAMTEETVVGYMKGVVGKETVPTRVVFYDAFPLSSLGQVKTWVLKRELLRGSVVREESRVSAV